MDGESKSIVRSCATCAKAKAKCVKPNNIDPCQRCARLKKECYSKDPVSRRKKIAKPSRTAQLEQLESKIEVLVHALSTSNNGQPSPKVSLSNETTSTQTAEMLDSLRESTGRDTSTSDLPSDLHGYSRTRTHQALAGISNSDTKMLIDRYQRSMASGLPYVVVPISTTPEALQADKPVLFRVICTVASFHNLNAQTALVNDIMREIGERILIRNEKSLDLLQAILVLVAWLHTHIFWRQQTTNLLNLAIAVVLDLSIDRPTTCQVHGQRTFNAIQGKSLEIPAPALEERRVLLGLFYITSTLSASFKKTRAMPFSPYMEECLDVLQKTREYESDLGLVQQVRVQRVIESIHTTESCGVPPRAYTKAFQSQLEGLRRTDPCEDRNSLLRMQYHTAEIHMWELSLNHLGTDRDPRISTYIDDLYRLHGSLGSFFEDFLAIPSSAYFFVAYPVFGQFAHALICLFRLVFLDLEGWDPRTLSDDFNFVHILDKVSQRCEEVMEAASHEFQVDNNIFNKWSSRIRWMKGVYEAKYSALQGREVSRLPETQLRMDFNADTIQQSANHEQRDRLSHQVEYRNGSTLQQNPQPTPLDDSLPGALFGHWDDEFWNTFATEFDLGYQTSTDIP